MNCDRCGEDIGNGSMNEAAHLLVLDTEGYSQSVRWCMRKCAPEVLTQDTIAARSTPLALFTPEPPTEEEEPV